MVVKEKRHRKLNYILNKGTIPYAVLCFYVFLCFYVYFCAASCVINDDDDDDNLP